MAVSLRVAISGLSALALAVVAAVALSVTLTASLAALRSIGTDHAAVLLQVANLRTEQRLRIPSVLVETMQNYSSVRREAWPTDNNTVWAQYSRLHELLFLQSDRSVAFISTFMMDDSRWEASELYRPSSFDTRHWGLEEFNADPVGVAGFGAPGRRVWRAAGSGYDWGTNRRTTLPLPPDPNVRSVVNSSAWRSMIEATGNARITAFPGLFAVNEPFGIGLTLSIMTITPLHQAGDPRTLEHLRGFTVCGMRTRQVSTFLAEVKGTPNTKAFALDGANFLLGSSEPKSFETKDEVSPGTSVRSGCATTEATEGATTVQGQALIGVVCRDSAETYGEPSLALGATIDAESPSVRFVPIDGTNYYLAVAPVPLRLRGMKLRIILAMPEADINGDVVRGQYLAIGLTVGLFLLTAAIVFGAISLLLAPLEVVAERMRRAANLEDDEEDASLGLMAEVRELQLAYYEMNSELNRIRAFVPQAVRMRPRSAEDDEGSIHVASGSDVAVNSASFGQAGPASTPSASSASYNSPVIHTHTGLSSGGGIVCYQQLTVLVANSVGFLAGMEARRGQVIQDIAGTVERVTVEIAAHGGVLDSFHGDHFVAVFNGVKACAGHARQASLCALRIVGSNTPEVGRGLRCGVATGRALIGNVGSKESMTFATLGAVYVQALALERMTRVYGCATLAPQRTCLDLESVVQFVYVDAVRLGPADVVKSRAAASGIVPVAALLRPHVRNDHHQPNKDVEWLYAIAAGDALDVFHEHNVAFAEACVGRVTSLPSDTNPAVGMFDAELRLEAVKEHVRKTGGAIEGYSSQGAQLYFDTLFPPPNKTKERC